MEKFWVWRKHSKLIFEFFNTFLKVLVFKFFKPFFNTFVKVPLHEGHITNVRTSCRIDAGQCTKPASSPSTFRKKAVWRENRGREGWWFGSTPGLFVCINPTTPCEPRTINPITQSASRSTNEQRLGTRQVRNCNRDMLQGQNHRILSDKKMFRSHVPGTCCRGRSPLPW